MIVPWPRPLVGPWGNILLASKSKGIYKPSWSRYAISVRPSLGSAYPDLSLQVQAAQAPEGCRDRREVSLFQ